MQKTICTASIFAAMVAVISALFVIHVPDTVWWWTDYPAQSQTWLIGWIFPNIIGPVCAFLLACCLLSMLWSGAAVICSRLRGEK